MAKNGLTLTMVFLAESANYGEGVGNISALKKMTRGNYEQYSYISRQAKLSSAPVFNSIGNDSRGMRVSQK